MSLQITGVSIVCSTLCSGADKSKHQSSASLAFVRKIHRWPIYTNAVTQLRYRNQMKKKLICLMVIIQLYIALLENKLNGSWQNEIMKLKQLLCWKTWFLKRTQHRINRRSWGQIAKQPTIYDSASVLKRYIRTVMHIYIYIFIQRIARNRPWCSLCGLHIRIPLFSLYGIRIPLFSLYGNAAQTFERHGHCSG